MESDGTAARIDFLSQAGMESGPLYPWGPAASYNSPVYREDSDATDRRDIELRQIGAALAGADALRGKTHPLAVVMAGPPGAGKSSTIPAVLSHLGAAGGDFVLLDPDTAKERLLRAAIADGTFDRMVPGEIRDGETLLGVKFWPMELAGLWHEESILTIEHARVMAVNARSNIVLSGTLNDSASSARVVRRFRAAGYETIIITDVEVDREVAKTRVRERYLRELAAAVESPLLADGQPNLGPRLVPAGTVDSMYTTEGHSRPARNAARFQAIDPKHVQLLTFRPDAAGKMVLVPVSQRRAHVRL